ncbi:MAG: DUF5919 domain-containing protein, partial [Angustibacter sp.]
LADVTRTNMHAMSRVRKQLSEEARDRLHVRTYDEPVRFNIAIADEARALVQLYMPRARGLDSPTFFIETNDGEPHGLYPIFAQVFAQTWERADVVEP